MFLLVMGICFAGEKFVYQHPTLNIKFEAIANWKRLPRPEDKNTYEIVDPDGSIHVVVWYTTTEQSGQNYLFLIQIWCQKEDYEQNKSLMSEILDSIEI